MRLLDELIAFDVATMLPNTGLKRHFMVLEVDRWVDGSWDEQLASPADFFCRGG